jgi:hypothetical protein
MVSAGRPWNWLERFDGGLAAAADVAATLCVNLVRGSFRCQPGFAAAEGE